MASHFKFSTSFIILTATLVQAEDDLIKNMNKNVPNTAKS